MLTKLKDYIIDKEFRLILFQNQFLVVNFSKVLSLEETRISFLTDYGRIVVKGEAFTLQKLLDDEVLIHGRVLGVEVFYE